MQINNIQFNTFTLILVQKQATKLQKQKNLLKNEYILVRKVLYFISIYISKLWYFIFRCP